MHGSIFILLKRFIEGQYDHSTWLKLLESSAISHGSYQMHEVYPDEEMLALTKSATKLTGLSETDLHERFGEYLVPDLLLVYKKYIRPEWRTMDMLEYTESAMHRAVRQENEKVTPPVLHVNRVNPNLIIIDYFSNRKMGGLAVGIIKGIARYYSESDQIKITPTSALNVERVQIRVEKIDPQEEKIVSGTPVSA